MSPTSRGETMKKASCAMPPKTSRMIEVYTALEQRVAICTSRRTAAVSKCTYCDTVHGVRSYYHTVYRTRCRIRNVVWGAWFTGWDAFLSYW
eukprot:5363374-Pleurochrysis_carterae.AAC.1